MKISIAMTTYNGEKYVVQQLESFLSQTRLPDEVIICDDCSLDSTTILVTDFIKKHHLDNWKLVKNKTVKGWQKNFLDAIQMTTGDVVFCSDQDDIWLENKLELMSRAMSENVSIKCLSGKIITIDEHGAEFVGKSNHDRGHGTGALTEISFDSKFNTIVLLGCTLCFTRDIASAIQEINYDMYGHDAQICRLSSIFDGTFMIDTPVIKYRIHASNTSGISANMSYGNSTIRKRINDVENNERWLVLVAEYLKKINLERKDEKINVVQKTINFLSIRRSFLTSKNPIYLLKLLHYLPFYANASMYIGDFCYAYNLNLLAGKIRSWFSSKKKNNITT